MEGSGIESNQLERQLLLYALEGKMDEVKNCIENGANVGAVDNLGSTPLHFVAQNGSQEVVSLLLRQSQILPNPTSSVLQRG